MRKYRPRNLERLGREGITVSIEADKDGLIGRECPDCAKYFKVEFGEDPDLRKLECVCPYCGVKATHDQFWTQDQLAYMYSVAGRAGLEAIYKDLKQCELDIRPRGPFGLGMSMKVEKPRPAPIHRYSEKELETEVVCDTCTLRYAVYGTYGYCPDCGAHNSAQILEMNLAVAGKMLALTADHPDLAEQIIGDALENGVSAFDGFGRETCRVRANHATEPRKAQNVAFQNLEGAKKRLADLFGIDLSAGLDVEEWAATCRGFQKRHVITHKSGIVDDEYVARTGDTSAVVGRKIAVRAEEVRRVLDCVRRLGQHLVAMLPKP